MTDKEFERVISFIVNENVIQRLLNSVEKTNKPSGHGITSGRFDIQITSPIELVN
jgi:hypothetical protein